MRIEELKSSLGDVKPVYLVEGDDAYLKELAVKHIKQKCLSAPELNYSEWDAASVKSDPGSFVEALMQYPFLSDKRVALLRDFAPTAAELKNKALAAYFAAPSPSTVLIIVNSSKSEALKKISCVTAVDCDKADASAVVKFLMVFFRREGLSITPQNARLIADMCLNDMARVNGEAQKLVAYCNGEGEVTRQAIEKLVTRDTDYRLYEMTDKVAKGDCDGALDIIKEMLEKDADEQKLFTSVYYYFRKLFVCSVWHGSKAELAAQLKIKEYAAKKTVEQAAKFSAKSIKAILDMFEKYDLQFKSGQITAEAAFFGAVFRILANGAKKQK